jgi:phage protein D
MAFRQAAFRVTVSGRDVSSALNPLLKSISVSDRDGVESDSCEITLADPDGSVLMPRKDDPITVLLGHDGEVGLVFTGFVDGVTSKGSKQGGRDLCIKGKSARPKSMAKQNFEKHLDDKTFGDAAREFGALAGLGVQVSGALASVTRKYWSLDNESFAHWGQRLARELGATFKIAGNTALFVQRNAGLSAGGLTLGTVRAVAGDNLLDWSIAPDIGRPQFKKVRVRYYDPKSAKWKIKNKAIDGTTAEAERTMRYQTADEDQADQNADGGKAASERNAGAGTVVIVGDAAAKPEGTLVVAGTRPGIDGSYVIEEVTHRFDKRLGYVCDVGLKRPQGASDSR